MREYPDANLETPRDEWAFDKLLETAHDKERPVVAGLVFAGFGIEGAPYPKPVPAIFQDAPEGFLPLYKYDKNSVFEIDAAGTGCLLIHRSVLEKMRETADKNQGPDWCWFTKRSKTEWCYSYRF